MPSEKSRTSGSLSKPRGRRGLITSLSLLAGVALWELGVRWLGVRPVLLPPPSQIVRAILTSWKILLYHGQATALEIVFGFALGTTVGVLLAMVFHLAKPLQEALSPYLVISQLVPKVALAPLLLIWLGFGMTPKIAIAALLSFFPTFINTFQGLSAYDPDVAFLMKCLRASPLAMLLRVQLPFSVPYILAGLRTSALLSVAGCVVGEFIGADRGLGFLLLQAEAQLDTPLLFAVLVALACLGALVYALPSVMESTIFKKYMPAASLDSKLLRLGGLPIGTR